MTSQMTGENTAIINADLGKNRIHKYIYGHFPEHLGRCIYDGVRGKRVRNSQHSRYPQRYCGAVQYSKQQGLKTEPQIKTHIWAGMIPKKNCAWPPIGGMGSTG